MHACMHWQGGAHRMPTVNLEEMMQRATHPERAMTDVAVTNEKTLMAMHEQHSSQLAEAKAEVERERKVRLECEQEASKLKVLLAQKTAELEGVRLAAHSRLTLCVASYRR